MGVWRNFDIYAVAETPKYSRNIFILKMLLVFSLINIYIYIYKFTATPTNQLIFYYVTDLMPQQKVR